MRHNPNTKEINNSPINAVVEPLTVFAKNSVKLLNRCTKPDAKEFKNVLFATAIGFLIMGFIGYFVKLVHIPINNILVGN